MTLKDKLKALDQALRDVEKQFGKGSLMRLGERPAVSVPSISTGCPSLDVALGVGGLPAGRVVEIYGPESSGKTTLMLEVIAGVQQRGGICAFVDAEHALDVDYARKLGVNPGELLVSQPDNGEQALEITDALVRSGAIDLVVIDSVAALVPRAEIEGEMGDNHVGLQARLMSQALRKLTSTAGRTGTTVVFINQLRQKIGVTFRQPRSHHRRQRAQVLREHSHRHPPHRDAQEGRRHESMLAIAPGSRSSKTRSRRRFGTGRRVRHPQREVEALGVAKVDPKADPKGQEGRVATRSPAGTAGHPLPMQD
jgi:RecA/RadA recombinase